MIPKANKSTDLLQIVMESGLYNNLLLQIQKDFDLSGQSIALQNTIVPEDLIRQLGIHIKKLIETNFDAYLQLLYRIDVPEHHMLANDTPSIDAIAAKATHIILQREWEKVYFRNKFSQME